MDTENNKSNTPKEATIPGSESPETLKGADLARFHIAEARKHTEEATRALEAELTAKLKAERVKREEAEAELNEIRERNKPNSLPSVADKQHIDPGLLDEAWE